MPANTIAEVILALALRGRRLAGHAVGMYQENAEIDMRYATLVIIIALASCKNGNSESATPVLYSPVDDVVYQIGGPSYVFFEKASTDTTREVRIVDVDTGLIREKRIAFLKSAETRRVPVEFTVSTTSGTHLAVGLLRGRFEDKQATIDDTLKDACYTANPFDLYLEQVTTGIEKTFRGEFRKENCIGEFKYAGEK